MPSFVAPAFVPDHAGSPLCEFSPIVNALEQSSLLGGGTGVVFPIQIPNSV
jgi:hypothetical protein